MYTHEHAGMAKRARTDAKHIVTEKGWKGLGAQKKYLSPLNCFITGIPSLLGMCSAETRPNWQSFPKRLAAPDPWEFSADISLPTSLCKGQWET